MRTPIDIDYTLKAIVGIASPVMGHHVVSGTDRMAPACGIPLRRFSRRHNVTCEHGTEAVAQKMTVDFSHGFLPLRSVAQATALVGLHNRFIHRCHRSENYDAYEVAVATLQTPLTTRMPEMLANDAITLTPANWLKARSGKVVRNAA